VLASQRGALLAVRLAWRLDGPPVGLQASPLAGLPALPRVSLPVLPQVWLQGAFAWVAFPDAALVSLRVAVPDVVPPVSPVGALFPRGVPLAVSPDEPLQGVL
jgi:hypothetical protein